MGLLHLTAGPLSMVFDQESAFLRYVRLRDREIVRGVFAAVRDQDWNTIPFTVHDWQIDRSAERFALSFVAKCSRGPIRFHWRGEVLGTDKGVVRFQFAGAVLNTFLRNRIGLCVLHPIAECAGQPCRVEHADGSVTMGTFPTWISPQQPFKNIRSITHTVAASAEAKVTFSGDVFEMEDQRNWTDASYKTYSTPLELPFPVEVAAGTRIEQTVTIEVAASVSGVLSHRIPDAAVHEPPRVRIDWDHLRRMPPIGLGMATYGGAASDTVVERLREVQPDHLRFDLHLGTRAWQERARSAIELAETVGTQLEVALFTADVRRESWQPCLELFRDKRNRIARWLVFHPTAKATPPDLAAAAYDAFREFDPSIPLVVGTNGYFAELNRNHPPIHEGSLVCYSINPQVHAFDNCSLRETIGAQRWTVDSAGEVFGCPVVVSPITLRPRFNPNATSTAIDEGQSPQPKTDPRQSTGFAAAWTVGTLAELAPHPGIASLTYFETAGPRGIMDVDGTPYPVLAAFKGLREYELIGKTATTHPLDVAAVALARADGGRGLQLANMSDEPQSVVVEVAPGRKIPLTLAAESVRYLSDEDLR